MSTNANNTDATANNNILAGETLIGFKNNDGDGDGDADTLLGGGDGGSGTG